MTTLASEGMRMLARRIRIASTGRRRYGGDWKHICGKIIEDCYDPKGHYNVSDGHFTQFYTRDFGMIAESLVNLGHAKRVQKTLEYALSRFSTQGKVTTQIAPSGAALDSFGPAADSLPMLIHGLMVSDQKELLEAYRPFLEAEVQRYFEMFFSKKTGVKRNTYVSSIRDQYTRDAACYSVSMMGMLSRDLTLLGWRNPLRGVDFPALLMKQYWMGKAFSEDLTHKEPSGDANTFPFWCGVITDPKIRRTALASVHAMGLDDPWPLKYNVDDPEREFWWARIISPNYEGNTIWMHLGLCYMTVLAKTDTSLFRRHLDTYISLVKKHKNFLEVYTPDGRPYQTLLYTTDESMSWCAILLDLARKA
ncbi:MAG: hypothetical protein ABIH41_01230 [Nanoarchaeota archaeon]